MKILVIGSGAREHALAWKLAKSPYVKEIFVAPGNFGTSKEEKITNLPIFNYQELLNFAHSKKISFTVVGPELPLTEGIVDLFRKHGQKIIGPTQYCALLESSKVFAKEFFVKNNINTAKYQVFNDLKSAKNYLSEALFPLVIKADGLASGKGVLVANNLQEAIAFTELLLTEKKDAINNNKIIIEECLNGYEASFIVLVGENSITPFPPIKDYKRLMNNDKGPNTGGMGSYAPSLKQNLQDRILQEIIKPTVDGMLALGHCYTGFLYAGLMIDDTINPPTINILEFNCRLGDPETQVLLQLIDCDFALLLERTLNHSSYLDIIYNHKYAVCVILTDKHYPEQNKNLQMFHLDDLSILLDNPKLKVFFGNSYESDDMILSKGGRMFSITSTADSLLEATNNIYNSLEKFKTKNMTYQLFYRTDIGIIENYEGFWNE